MTSTTEPRADRASGGVSTLLFGLTILLSAFLLFQVQPLIAKLILPWFGGSAAVWTTCMLFFQLALLGGYAYAHWLIDHPGKRQTFIHVGLMLLSLAALPILPSATWKPMPGADPLWRILGLLAATVGLPYFLLSSTSPLLQSWYSRSTGGAMPYRFFALSNIGSMVGLLSYPIFVEPWLRNQEQAWMWSGGYVLFVIVCATVALTSRSTRMAAEQETRTESGPAPSLKDRLLWMMLAACPSALLLAMTNHLTQNIAPIPFLWVLPLCLYLLSFILCFDSDRWYRRGFFGVAAGIALPWMAFEMIEQKIGGIQLAVAFFSAVMFILFMVCHGELSRRRPAPRHLTGFFLMVSLGGAIGGLLIGFAAPIFFNALYDLPLVVTLTTIVLLTLLWRGQDRVSGPASEDPAKDNRMTYVLAGLLLAFVAYRMVGAVAFKAPKFLSSLYDTMFFFGLAGMAGAYLLARARAALDRRMLAFVVGAGIAASVTTSLVRNEWRNDIDSRVLVRNFYGALKVYDNKADTKGAVRILRHGTIDHGEQFLDMRYRRQATAYFTHNSGIGVAMLAVDKLGPKKVGVIGLGAGTLAAYGRGGDQMRFYDINPLVKWVADTQFYFLRDCPAANDFVLGDARLVLEQEPSNQYDVLVVDAFSGDAIPVHLLTAEAWKLYWKHLKPDGVLAVHVSNKYLRLAPVVALGAEASGKEARLVTYEDDTEEEEASSDWVIVTGREGFFDQPGVKEKITVIKPIPGLKAWTDDYSNLYRILR